VVGSSNGTLYDIDTKRDTVYLINQARRWMRALELGLATAHVSDPRTHSHESGRGGCT
jgi:hypothetical protein